MIIVPYDEAVIASSGNLDLADRRTSLRPGDISLKLTMAVVSGLLLGDMVLISSQFQQVIYSFNLTGI